MLRGFDYDHPVVAEPVSQTEIGRDIVKYADTAYPKGQYARRSVAWDTIGVIPDGTSLRDAYESYGSSQVIGYYDTVTGELEVHREPVSLAARADHARARAHARDRRPAVRARAVGRHGRGVP